MPRQRPQFQARSAARHSARSGPVPFVGHVLARLVYSPSRAARVLRLVAAALAVALGLAALIPCLFSVVAPTVYTKDFLQEYLLARAIADGTDPYLPVQALADHYLGALPYPVFDHPTPHPPPAGLLFLPLALLGYSSAVAVWLGLEIVCLAGSVYLLARGAARRLPLWGTLVIATTMVAWYPFFWDLGLGQLMVVLLVLIAGAQLALLSGRPILGGAILGLAILVKPVPWPLLLLFALRRDWRVLGASVVTIMLGYSLAGWVMGFDRIVTYFTQVLPAVTAVYKVSSGNLSAWSVGWRVFHGTEAVRAGGIASPPLLESPVAAIVVSAGLPALVLLIACLVVRKRRSLAQSFGVMVCASILITPIAWGHYLVLLAIPAAQVIHWLMDRRLPSAETNTALLVAGLMLLPESFWTKLAYLAAGQSPVGGEPSALPFAPALLTFTPALAVGALGWLVATLGPGREGPTS